MSLEAVSRDMPGSLGRTGRFLSAARQSGLVVTGSALIGVAVIAAIIGPLIAPYDPTGVDVFNRLAPPSSDHWLGTDELGRDILSRLLHGARLSLVIGVSITMICATLGTILGSLVGLVGGRLDQIAMRFVDVWMSLPGLVLAIAISAALGPSLFNAALALAIIAAPGYLRLARGEALALRSSKFIDAARLYGTPTWMILLRHILPNILPALMVAATLSVGTVILAAAALSFLGLGAQPPTPEWGAMVASGRSYIVSHPWYPIAPGLAILLTAAGFNILGDGLNDVLNPNSPEPGS